MKINTLSSRLFLFTSLWMVISLAIVALIVSQDYRRTVENQFEEIVTANLYNLMGTIKRGTDGDLIGAPNLGDPRFQSFQSGWYWTVNAVSDDAIERKSLSLGDIKLPSLSSVKYDADFQRAYRVKDGAGNNLMAVEAQVFLGEGDHLYAFRSTGNLAVLDEGISQFRQRLVLLLAIFGAGLIVTSFAIVRFGLKPISIATSQLSQIRAGKAEKIEGEFPKEISPLIDETNALIKSNLAIVERSRIQVGNLAHSLKTPLSILALEVKKLSKPHARTFSSQLNSMNDQVKTYLNRAMISARHGAITSRTDLTHTLSRLVRSFSKLFPEKQFRFDENEHRGLDFAGDQQDLEEIVGNLLENAGNSARTSVDIEIEPPENATDKYLCLVISDDGPGLSFEEIKFVMKRGNRLDENRPGSGLGLSIVHDILTEYGGKMEIDTAKSGGLRVRLYLPIALQH